MPFKRMLVAITLLLLALPAMAERNPMFTVITSAEEETQMMALILSMQAIEQDRSVRILLCDAGGELALADKDEGTVFEPAGRTPQQLLTGLIQRGVQVDVCAIFLPQREAGEDDLIEGVGSARAPEVGEYMATPEVRYFTF